MKLNNVRESAGDNSFVRVTGVLFIDNLKQMMTRTYEPHYGSQV